MARIHWVEEGSNEEEKRKQIEAELRTKLEAEAAHAVKAAVVETAQPPSQEFNSPHAEVSVGDAEKADVGTMSMSGIAQQRAANATVKPDEKKAAPEAVIVREVSDRSWLKTLLFCLFLGWYSVHRFYARKIISGVLFLLLVIAASALCANAGENDALATIGGFMILGWFVWWIVDVVMIATGKFTDKSGKLILRRKQEGRVGGNGRPQRNGQG